MARFNVPITQLVNDDASSVAAGWQLFFYDTGTTTFKDTFSDSALTSANANPVVADSAGRFGDIFLESGTYKVVLKDANDVEKWTADPVEGTIGSSGAVRSTSISETLTVSDATKLIDVDTSGGAKTITLLPAATAGDGFEVGVRKNGSDANAVTNDADGAETINGTATRALYRDGETEWYRTDGSEWFVTRKFIDPAQWTDIASAATTDLAVADGNYGDITGAVTITALGTAPAGTVRTARTVSTPTFTHNATSLILPTAANIVAEAGDVFEFTSLGSGNWRCTNVQRASGESISGLPRSYRSGCIISNDAGDTAHDVNMTAGAWRNADNDGDLVLTSEITKQGDATWAAGDDAGGLSSSLTALANDTWYHVFLIEVSGSIDVGFDTSITAANLIADHGATSYRQVKSVKTNGSANFKQFHQVSQNEIWWDYDEVADAEHTVTNVGANGTAVALDNIPDGRSTIAMIGIAATGGASTGRYGVVRGDQTITASPSAGGSNVMGDYADTTVSALFMRVPADASQQVKMFGHSTTQDFDISVWGWIDERSV